MSASLRLVASEPCSIWELRRKIIGEHEQAEADFRSALAHVIRAGELLSEAKAHIRHGEWGRWVLGNLPFTQRTAQHYMRCAANAQAIAHFATMTEALAALAVTKPLPKPPPKPELAPLEQMPGQLDLITGELAPAPLPPWPKPAPRDPREVGPHSLLRWLERTPWMTSAWM